MGTELTLSENSEVISCVSPLLLSHHVFSAGAFFERKDKEFMEFMVVKLPPGFEIVFLEVRNLLWKWTVLTLLQELLD